MWSVVMAGVFAGCILVACGGAVVQPVGAERTLPASRCTATARLELPEAGADAVAVEALGDGVLIAWVHVDGTLRLTELPANGAPVAWTLHDQGTGWRPTGLWSDGDAIILTVTDAVAQRGTWFAGTNGSAELTQAGADFDAGHGARVAMDVVTRGDGRPLVVGVTVGQDLLHFIDAFAGDTAPVRTVAAGNVMQSPGWRREGDVLAAYAPSDLSGPVRVHRFEVGVADRAVRLPLTPDFGNPEVSDVRADARVDVAGVHVAWLERTGAGRRLAVVGNDGVVTRSTVQADATLGPWMPDGTVLLATGQTASDAATDQTDRVAGASSWFDARPLAFARTRRDTQAATWAVTGVVRPDGQRMLTVQRVRCGL